MKRTVVLLSLMILLFSNCASTGCPFDKNLLEFDGTARGQALCLLRPVGKWGKLGPRLSKLPQPLSDLIGTKFDIDKSKIEKLIDIRNLSPEEIGGEIDAPLSKAKAGDDAAPTARYFVIHDTSTPNYKLKKIPDNINTSSWRHNNLTQWDKGSRSKAHLFIT